MSLITITEGANEHLSGIVKNHKAKGIMLGVKSGGCSGLSYDLKFDKQQEDIWRKCKEREEKRLAEQRRKEEDELRRKQKQEQILAERRAKQEAAKREEEARLKEEAKRKEEEPYSKKHRFKAKKVPKKVK